MIPVSAATPSLAGVGPYANGPLGPGKVLKFNMVNKNSHSRFLEMAGM